MIYNVLILCFLSLKCHGNVGTNRNCTVLWWNIKPYLYKENGTVKGIINDIMKNTKVYCPKHSFQHLNYENASFGIYPSFFRSIQSKFTLKFNKKKINASDIIWFPVISPKVKLEEKEYAFQNIFKATGAIVIIKRDIISLPNRAFAGISKAKNILLLSVLFIACFGIIVWLWVGSQNILK